MTETSEINAFRPRRLRITEAGWETFTGVLGITEFAGGVSVHQVPWQEQQRIGSLIRMETAEDGESGQINAAVELTRNRSRSADDPMVEGVSRGIVVNGETRLAVSNYSREELEELADRKGINGLRDIAKAWEVTGRSINELINKILEAQQGAAGPEPLPADAVAEKAESDAGADG